MDSLDLKFKSSNNVPVTEARITLAEYEQFKQLEAENAELKDALSKYENGYKGSCYACEPVGELNVKLEEKITHMQDRWDCMEMIDTKIKQEGIREMIPKLKEYEVRSTGHVRFELFDIEDYADNLEDK